MSADLSSPLMPYLFSPNLAAGKPAARAQLVAATELQQSCNEGCSRPAVRVHSSSLSDPTHHPVTASLQTPTPPAQNPHRHPTLRPHVFELKFEPHFEPLLLLCPRQTPCAQHQPLLRCSTRPSPRTLTEAHTSRRGLQECWGSAERWLISFSTTMISKQPGQRVLQEC